MKALTTTKDIQWYLQELDRYINSMDEEEAKSYVPYNFHTQGYTLISLILQYHDEDTTPHVLFYKECPHIHAYINGTRYSFAFDKGNGGFYAVDRNVNLVKFFCCSSKLVEQFNKYIIREEGD
jgi:hypothetical protein